MAGGNDTVTTIFGGDDSNFQGAARKVKSSVEELAHFASPMQFFAKAKEGAESMHAATEHAKEGVESLKSALEPLIAMGAALIGVESVFEGIKKSIEAAAKVETAEFHLGAVAGGADKAKASIEELHKTSEETATGFAELAQGSIRLQEAGQSADQAAESMGRLEKIALNSGSDVNELGEIYARVLTKADVSSKDLVKLAMTGVPGIKAISEEYKNLERNTATANLGIDKTIQNLNRLFEQTEKQVGSVNSFGSKIGLMQASFDTWAAAGGKAVGGLVKAIDGVSEAGIGKMSGTFGKEFSDGLRQIETETGLSGSALQKFMADGKLGYDELIAAAGRFREEQHKAEDANLEAQKLANQNALLNEQKGLLGKVRDAIEKATNKGGIFASVDEFFQTFNGKWQQVQHAIDEGFEAFGKPLIDALKPVLDQVTAFFKGPGKEAVTAWGNSLGGLIKDAMEGLTKGNWEPLKKDGESAFAAILKAASKGIDDLGLTLQAAFQGEGMVKAIAGISKMLAAVAEAFGEALSQSAASPLRKLEALDVMINPVAKYAVAARNKGDLAKFTDAQKQEFTDEGGGKDISQDSEIIAKIKGFSGVMVHITEASKGASEAMAGFAAVAKAATDKMAGRDESETGKNADGKPTGMDQDTWDMWYKPLTPKVEAKTAETPEEANRDATTTVASPLATAAAIVPPGSTDATAAASGTGFAPFQVNTSTGKGKRDETKRSERSDSGKGAAEKSGNADDETPYGPLPATGSNDGGGLRQLTVDHFAMMKQIGMQPIGDVRQHLNPDGSALGQGVGDRGFKGTMDATGVEHSLSGAIGPGGAMPWQAPPERTQDQGPVPGARMFGAVREATPDELADIKKEHAARGPASPGDSFFDGGKPIHGVSGTPFASAALASNADVAAAQGVTSNIPAPTTTAGVIGAAPAAPASAAPSASSGASAMSAGVQSVLAKMEAIIAAIGKEAGLLEKVLS